MTNAPQLHRARLKMDLGLFAHNEERNIQSVLANILNQDLFQDCDLRILVLDNGSNDRTSDLAASLAKEHPRLSVLTLPEAGKSRAWNDFVHHQSRHDADHLIFCDADIELPSPDCLRRLVASLLQDQALHAATSRPVKDIQHTRQKLSLIERIIALAGGTSDDWRTSICGQLYAMPARRAREHHMPIGLPVEDGFLRAMVLTDHLTHPEDSTRIAGSDCAHIYESERTIPGLIRHQTRIVIGSAINFALFHWIRSLKPEDRASALARVAKDDEWLTHFLRSNLPRAPFGFVPFHFLTKRTFRYMKNPRSLLQPRNLVVCTAGLAFDSTVFLLAQIKMARGIGAGYW
jgi:glycosyltransferase involved in cell wall biosynthesis